MPERDLSILAWALGDGPDAAFAAADAAALRLADRRYATILRLEGGLGRRLFSSVPGAYPVGDAKPLLPSPWRTRVVERGEAFMAADPDAIAAHFPDHALVASLGGRCLANLPVRGRRGEVLGLFNVAAGRAFTEAELRHLRLLAALLGPAVAAWSPKRPTDGSDPR